MDELKPSHQETLKFLGTACRNWQHIAPLTNDDVSDVARALASFAKNWNTRSECPAVPDVEQVEALDWTGGRAFPDLLENIAQYWSEWEEDRAGTGTYLPEELAENAGEFATGLADHLAALASQLSNEEEEGV